MEQQTHHFPWWIAGMVIAGLIIGYSVVVLREEQVFANAVKCPLQQMCTHGECTAACPGNCPHHGA